MDKILAILNDLKVQLEIKRNCMRGVVANQASIDHRQKTQRKIDTLNIKINKVEEAISLRTSELGDNPGATNVPAS